MITIVGVSDLEGNEIEHMIDSELDLAIDGRGLTLFPGLIDPHVHFRTPGLMDKENWETGAKAAIAGGYTTVIDMPNTLPPCITLARLRDKQKLINKQLRKVGIPLHYGLYIGADKLHFDEIKKVKKHVVGIKVFMGSSTGDLVMDDESSLHAIFTLAHAHDLLISVHAEDEEMIQERKKQFLGQTSFETHSQIRSVEVACKATEKAIELAKTYDVRLNLLHISTKEELAIIKKAKDEGLKITAETTPHHLFLDTSAYATLGGKAQMNPPLRSKGHGAALMQGIRDGVIDMVGSDHAPHTLEEKKGVYGMVPSGVPGIETMLPLLLNAYHHDELTLKKIVEVTYDNPLHTFSLKPHHDVVLIDLNKEKEVFGKNLMTKCKWSPYEGWKLKGWPIKTIIKGKVYDCEKI